MWSPPVLILLLSTLCGAQSGRIECPLNNVLWDRSRVLFEREGSVENFEHSVYLIVDQDDRIRLFYLWPNDCASLSERSLGVAVERSGNLTLAEHVAEGEIPFLARRLSVSPEIVVHFVLTWGPMTRSLIEKVSDPDAPGYWPPTVIGYNLSYTVLHLYILRESESSVEQLYREDQGTRFIDFDLVDATGDGKVEAVLTGRTHPTNRRLGIWRIGREGDVSRLSLPPEAEENDPLLRPSVGEGMAPFIVAQRRQRRDEVTIVREDGYRWDEQRGEFVLKHSSTEERRRVRP